MKRRNFQRGYTLLEAVIAFTIIAIGFGAAMTAVMFSFTVRRRVDNEKFFIFETQNYLECYKMQGSSGFKSNTYKYLNVSLGAGEADENGGIVYKIYYTAGYAITDEQNAAFVLEISVNNSFVAKTYEKNRSKEIYAMDRPFVSHYDL